jgi:hypothetical protein
MDHLTLEWVDWCCVLCGRRRRTIAWVAAMGELACRHTGTKLESAFWRAGGEPSTADLQNDAWRRESAAAEAARYADEATG